MLVRDSGPIIEKNTIAISFVSELFGAMTLKLNSRHHNCFVSTFLADRPLSLYFTLYYRKDCIP